MRLRTDYPRLPDSDTPIRSRIGQTGSYRRQVLIKQPPVSKLAARRCWHVPAESAAR